jgi:hypothetical protein
MTFPTTHPTAADEPTWATARILRPVLVAALVALISVMTLVALVQGVLATGGSIALLAIVLVVATVSLVVLLGLLFRRLEGRPRWLAATVIALADLGVYLALFVTGTTSPSVVSSGPELAIAAVALATGAASAVTLPGGWRALGVVGLLALAWLALTPVLV